MVSLIEATQETINTETLWVIWIKATTRIDVG
jgi:hypothetical protein